MLMCSVTKKLAPASASGLPNMPLDMCRLSPEPNLKVDLFLITPLHSAAFLPKLRNHSHPSFKIPSQVYFHFPFLVCLLVHLEMILMGSSLQNTFPALVSVIFMELSSIL